jgi:ribosomal protein S18 acetylase RimI-like enzyme
MDSAAGPATLSIEPATHADLAALHALVESAYRGDSARGGWTHEADLVSGDRTSQEDLRQIIEAPGQEMLIARDEGGLVGCVMLANPAPGLAYLGMLCVSPRLQAKGLGKQLIAAAEARARTVLGAGRLEMCVISRRSELIAYYERRGYRRTGEMRPFPVVMDPPLALAVLEKPLA